ncbi:MAG TPA: antibiotic biosynthesis monooxygenase [Bacteroidota bacterium]
MFMRIVHLRLDPNRLLELRRMYPAVIIAELSHTPGCLYAGLLQSVDHPDLGISLTLWNSAADAESYEKTGAYRRLLDQSRPYLAESPEWTVHMSDDMQREYAPVEQEPPVSRYESSGKTDPSIFSAPGKGRLYLRIVSLHVRRGMLEEFTSLYRQEIIPGLRRIPGYRFAFLSGGSDDSHELISVTIWNSKSDAEQYEKSGEFDALTERVSHTLEDSTRWNTEEQGVERAVGSDDMTVSGYALIVGQVFDPGS